MSVAFQKGIISLPNVALIPSEPSAVWHVRHSFHFTMGLRRFIDAQAELGFGAVHMACSQGHLHAVKALLKAGDALDHPAFLGLLCL